MTSISAGVKLRPTRIGFLIRPNDLKSLRRIFRISTCLWGGTYNPIIPVCHSVPNAWRREPHDRISGRELTDGYIHFFEPDVYVEAQSGLSTECGIDTKRESSFGRRIVSLDDFIVTEEGRAPVFAFGQSIFDLYRDLYSKEYKFQPRHPRNVVLMEGGPNEPFYEAVAGAFPKEQSLSYFRQGFLDAFDPSIQEATSDAWMSCYEQQAMTPLSLTEYGLQREPDGFWDPTIFIVDPRSPYDLIDLWNLRQFKTGVLPVPSQSLSVHKDALRQSIIDNHRPLPRNPNGVMIHTTVEFARSIKAEEVERICGEFFSGLPERSWARKTWYQPIWRREREDAVSRPTRAVIEAKSVDLDIVLGDDGESITFPSISPDFARRYGGANARWVNVVQLKDYSDTSRFALIQPSSAKDAKYLIGLDRPLFSREGIVLPQRYKGLKEYLRLANGRKAIVEWLAERQIVATPSDAGRITDQVLSAVGGLKGAGLLGDEATLKLLDKMSKSIRSEREGTFEEYPDRTAHVREWVELIKRRKETSLWRRLSIDAFVKAGALKLGLEVKCPTCEKKNWYGIAQLDLDLTCDRCLRRFEFPQGSLDFGNAPWRYRVAGPFSVPDFANGAYATALALRCLGQGLDSGVGDSITYTTNLNLSFDSGGAEIDFACWYARERVGFGLSEEPTFVVGEAKSFAVEAFDERDASKLKRVASKIPGTVIVVAVMKDSLSEAEKDQIGRLALWGRKPLRGHGRRAPVIVLTGKELFADHHLRHEWENTGGKWQELVKPGYVRMDNLTTFADLTQQLYLDLPDYWTWWDEYARKQHDRRKRRS